MATQTLFSSSVGGNAVTLSITFDDVTLHLVELVYSNTTAQPAALVLTGPVNTTILAAANDARTIDLSTSGVTLVKTTGTNKLGPFTAYNLPGGEQMSFRWPA